MDIGHDKQNDAFTYTIALTKTRLVTDHSLLLVLVCGTCCQRRCIWLMTRRNRRHVYSTEDEVLDDSFVLEVE